MRHAIVISSILLAGAVPASADQQTVDRSATARFGVLRPAQANPYGRLFEAREALKQATEQAAKNATPAPKKKIVCGMTVIEVGPALDPKMGVTPPQDDKVTYTIRAIDPPVCNPSTAK
jgi:hypothetical protein